MRDLKESFEDVADWCERHLERHRGREIGMTFGAMLRAYARLATMPDDPEDVDNVFHRRQANEQAEALLRALSIRFFVAYDYVDDRWKKLAEPAFVRTNMIYDRGPQRDQS